MKINKVLGFLGMVLQVGLSIVSVAAHAQSYQTYPSKPIKLIVPFTPGGSSDILGRAIGQELSKAFGQPVVIENVPGAGGSLGATKAAKSAADGYTLLMAHIGTLAVNPLIYPSLSYDPIKSFDPVAWVARVPNILVVHPSVKANTVAELVALLKANPGKLNYGSGGNGSAAQLTTEYFKLKTHTFIVHVPYRGTVPAITDVISGQIQMAFTGAPAVLPFIKSGQLKAIAVSSVSRLDGLPLVPTIREAAATSGLKPLADFEADQWYGVVAPAGTPPQIVAKLNAHVQKALSSPEMQGRLQTEGAIAMPSSPEVFGQLIQSELVRWAPVIKAGRIKLD